MKFLQCRPLLIPRCLKDFPESTLSDGGSTLNVIGVAFIMQAQVVT